MKNIHKRKKYKKTLKQSTSWCYHQPLKTTDHWEICVEHFVMVVKTEVLWENYNKYTISAGVNAKRTITSNLMMVTPVRLNWMGPNLIKKYPVYSNFSFQIVNDQFFRMQNLNVARLFFLHQVVSQWTVSKAKSSSEIFLSNFDVLRETVLCPPFVLDEQSSYLGV